MIPLNEWSRCQNCNRLFPTNDLGPAEDLDQRIGAGEIAPSGQCPKCGAVCHLIRPDVIVEVRGGVVQAVYTAVEMRIFIVDWDNFTQGDRPGPYIPDLMDEMDVDVRAYVERDIRNQLKEAVKA